VARLSERVLTTRELNRALLARQLLLERSGLSIPRAVEQLAGLQTQYAPSAYIRLWTSLQRFELGDLTRALERKRVVQGTLMRSTIHIVSPRDFWGFSAGIGPSREAWWLRTHGPKGAAVDLQAIGTELRRKLAGGTRHRSEVAAILGAHGSDVWNGAWVELVRVPPSGTWERRRADLFRLASEWIRRVDVTEEQGLEHLLRSYLRGFGPARLADAASWAGVPVAKLKPGAERVRLRTFSDDEGRLLLDLPRARLPGDIPVPVRFLPTWDATLLVHARRTQILPEEYRALIFNTKNPQSVSTFLVDGSVAGTWRAEQRAKKATLVIAPFERLPRNATQDVVAEAERLVRFLDPGAASFATRVAGSA
jgi:Winged helix DNA-binding domain